MAGTLRAGVIGLGAMGRNHARVLSQLEGVDLVVAADPRRDADPGVPGLDVVPSLDGVLGRGIDMCVVAAPTTEHENLGVRLAAARVPTLIEKPLAPDVDTAIRIAAAFDAAEVLGCVGHIERYNPALQSLRKRLADDQLGEVYQVATRRQGPYPVRISDVGVALDLATHDVDLTAWVTGRAYAELSARTAHRSGRSHEDLVAAVGQLEGGVVVSHLVNWLSPLKERVVTVTGERGAFVADTLTADLTFFANGIEPIEWDTLANFRGVVVGDVIRYAIPKPEPLVTELTAFRDAVLGLSNDVVSMRDAASVVRVAQALLWSADEGLVTRLSFDDTADIRA